MTDKIITGYGRVGGELKYILHPPESIKDWNSVFTALEVIALLTKLPGEPISNTIISNTITDGPEPFEKAAEPAQKLTRDQVLKDLQLTLGNNDYLKTLMIWKTTTHWYKANEVSSKLFNLPSDGDERISALVDYLSSAGLNAWEVLLKISKVLGEAEAKHCDSVTIDFTF